MSEDGTSPALPFRLHKRDDAETTIKCSQKADKNINIIDNSIYTNSKAHANAVFIEAFFRTIHTLRNYVFY